MQIELMGCTSTGKSTLAKRILDAHHKRGIDIELGDDFVLRQVRLDWVKSHLARKLLLNLVALGAGLIAWRGNLELYLFAARLLAQLPLTQRERLNTLKNVLKRVGIYEIIRFRSTDQQVILIDEGVLQAAHYLFVHVSARAEPGCLPVFAGLVPLPDAIIYVRQSESALIDRTIQRGHKRIPDRSYGNVAPFIKRAVATFDQLSQCPEVESRLLVIDPDQSVRIAANDQDDPILGLALGVVQSAFASDTTDAPAEPTLLLDRPPVPMSTH